MADTISIKISPLPYYNKYASSSYILCGIDFDIYHDGINHHFRSESSNNCIKKLLSEIDDYLYDKLSPQIASASWTPAGRNFVIIATVLVGASDSTKIGAAAAGQAA